MELYVLSDIKLDSMTEWQNAIAIKGFDVVLGTERPLSALGGLMSVRLAGDLADFECDHWKANDALEGYPEIRVEHHWRYCLAFRFGASFKACVAAYMAAAAYAAAVNGVVLECDRALLLNPQEAEQAARQAERDAPAMEQAVRDFAEKLRRPV